MELDSSFTVQAPVERVWATLMDIERVAGCLPGAEVLGKLSDDAYQLGVKVKLGPVTMQYRGQLDVVERDESAHRAVLSGQAKETKGQGTAKATATMTLTETAGATLGTIHTDLALLGKAAAMGKSVIGSVSDQLMKSFAANLQTMMDEPAVPDAALPDANAVPDTTAAPDTAAAPVDAAAGPADVLPAAGQPAAAAPAPPTGVQAPPRAEAAPVDNSLNGLTLAKGIVLGQLSDPKKLRLVAVLGVVVAYLLGRRSGRRWTRIG